MKFTKEAIKKGQDKRKPKLVFDCPEYSIHEIPLNYMIRVKLTRKVKDKTQKIIGEEFYSNLERGVEGAKGLAERSISEALEGSI